MKLIHDVFPDIYAFKNALETRPENGKFCGMAKTGDEELCGMSLDKALAALTTGVPADVERMKREVRQFTAKTTVVNKRVPINYYNGHSPNVPAAIIGLPKSMRKTVKTPHKTKIVTLIYSMGGLGGVSAETLTESACTAVKLAVYLECNGYRVNIYACPSMAKEGSETAACVIKLKDAKQPLDIGKISFTMGNVAMFRRLGWRWRETAKGITGSGWYSGYGKTIYDHETAEAILKEMGIATANAYYFNIKDCEKARYDAVKLAVNMGIVKEG